MMSSQPDEDRISRLIRATEERARAELRVAKILEESRRDTEQILSSLVSVREAVTALLSKTESISAQNILLAEMLGAMSADDQRKLAKLQERLVNGLSQRQPISVESGGIRVGESSEVDISGDMVGGSKKKG